MPEKYKIVVPFSGFYESDHGAQMGAAIECELDTDPGERALVYDDLVIDNKGFMKEYAEAYLEAVVYFLEYECDISLDLELFEVNSPKEYNFETDQIVAYISEEGIKALLEHVDWLDLEADIQEQLKIRDGFFTSRSNNMYDWLFRGIKDWDSIELGFLMEQFFTSDQIEVDLGHEIASNHIAYKMDSK